MTNSAARPIPSRGIAKHHDFPKLILFLRNYRLFPAIPDANDHPGTGADRTAGPASTLLPRPQMAATTVTSEVQLAPAAPAIPPSRPEKVVNVALHTTIGRHCHIHYPATQMHFPPASASTPPGPPAPRRHPAGPRLADRRARAVCYPVPMRAVRLLLT